MKPRIIYIHGNQATHWSFAWAKRFKDELEKNGFETFFETFPDSVIAREEYWIPFLEKHIQAGENDVIVGWSSGALAAMRYTESRKIKGSVLVSPCVTDLDDELEKQSGYFSRPWEWEKMKANQEEIAVFYGDDDPYIPQSEFETVVEKLNPETFKIPGGKHFIEKETFPELLEYILNTYSK